VGGDKDAGWRGGGHVALILVRGGGLFHMGKMGVAG
jgi:hypothetical protein